MHIQITNTSSSTISRVHGIFFDSFDISSAAMVVMATSMANGMLVEKPQAMRCGFM